MRCSLTMPHAGRTSEMPHLFVWGGPRKCEALSEVKSGSLSWGMRLTTSLGTESARACEGDQTGGGRTHDVKRHQTSPSGSTAAGSPTHLVLRSYMNGRRPHAHGTLPAPTPAEPVAHPTPARPMATPPAQLLCTPHWLSNNGPPANSPTGPATRQACRCEPHVHT